MIWFFLPRMLASAFAVVILLALTRLLPPADYGRYNIILLTGTILFSLVFSWIASSIVRFNASREFTSGSVALGIGLFAAMIPVFVVVGVLATWLAPEDYRVVVGFACCFALAFAIHEVALAGLRVRRRGPEFAAITILRPIAGLALTLSIVSLGYGYAGAVIGMALGAGLVGLIGLMLVVRSAGIGRPSIATLTSFYKFGAPGSVVASGVMIQTLITQSLIAGFVDLKHVGFFAAAQVLATRVISMPMITLSRSVSSTIFDTFETSSVEATDAALSRHLSFLVLLAVPISSPLLFSNHTISFLMFEGAFQSVVADHLPILAFAALLSGFQGAYLAFAFTLSRRTAFQFYILLGLIAIQTVAAFVLVQTMGAIGASLAVATTALCGVIAYVLLGARVGRQIAYGGRQLAVAAAAMIAYFPFGFAADQNAGTSTAVFLVLAGLVAIAAVFLLLRQTALIETLTRLSSAGRRLLFQARR